VNECDLKTSHFAISRAVLYIQNASSAQDSVKRQQSLDGAHRSLIEALEQGQTQNPAAWYFLGVYYSYEGDAAGADSAFDKVEGMMPSCEKDVDQYRYMAWAGATNKGIDAMRENDYDKAKSSFALANQVYAKKPTALFYLATLFATEDNADSAVHYFKIAAKAAEGDTAETEIHEKATQNVARIYQVLEKWDSAQAYFKAYLQLRPEDLDGQTNLATAYLSSGDTASAVSIYDATLSKADSMEPVDVFRIGVQLFRADHPDRAAIAFEKGLARDPYYRNGLFNLTNAYFSLAQASQQPDSVKYWAGKMLPVAQRLAQVDPQNRGVLRLVAAAHQFVGNGDSTDAVLKKVNQMEFEVDVQSARAGNNGYDVQGTITALKSTAAQVAQDSITRDSTQLETLKQTQVPAAQRAQLQRRQATLQTRLSRLRAKLQTLGGPVSVPAITFQFLDKDGNVAATESVPAQGVEQSRSKQFQLSPTAQGIVAWRYRVGTAP
jgi:tetratricopeptide (TPR) repeat protein